MISIDQGTVSWRFKALIDTFPFVLITTPTDYWLWREDDQPRSEGTIVVRAIVCGKRPLSRVTCQLNQDEPIPVQLAPDGDVWQVELALPKANSPLITVEAIDNTGRPGRHTIGLITPFAHQAIRYKAGSDADLIGGWPQNGILGTQLGPNRNSRHS